MSSAPQQSAMSAGDLANALKGLGESDHARDGLIKLLREYESRAAHAGGVNVREVVTGPILDAAIGHGQHITKRLSSGLLMSVKYTSKIVRDFIMSDDPIPDHVWEPQTTRALLELARDARNVVIGGAYFGDHAVPLAHQIADSGTVHCFEVSQQNADLLALNARQNDIHNIRINRVGLWSTGDVRLTLSGEDSHAAPSATLTTGTDTFPVTTIDSYAHSLGLHDLDLIMLDIEGGELEALKGAQSFLGKDAKSGPILIFEVHGSYSDWSNGLDQSEIIRFVTSFGYTVFAIRDYHSNVAMHGRSIELVELDDVYIEGPPHGFNILATRRPENLDLQLFSICRGVSPKLLLHRDPKLHAPLS